MQTRLMSLIKIRVFQFFFKKYFISLQKSVTICRNCAEHKSFLYKCVCLSIHQSICPSIVLQVHRLVSCFFCCFFMAKMGEMVHTSVLGTVACFQENFDFFSCFIYSRRLQIQPRKNEKNLESAFFENYIFCLSQFGGCCQKLKKVKNYVYQLFVAKNRANITKLGTIRKIYPRAFICFQSQQSRSNILEFIAV